MQGFATLSPTPPARLSTLASRNVAAQRGRVGRYDAKDWQRAVSIRDPVSQLKRSHPHVNRATFKLHEIVARLFAQEGRPPPRNAAFLAEAPGGFLYCARRVWPGCVCVAMSSTAPNAIRFSHADPAVLHDLPHDADLRHADVEAALVERCGAAAIEFVSADGGAEVNDLDLAEQHSTPLVLAQAAAALALQAQGGSLVLKVFEGCTLVTRQLFETLRELYDRIMLFKPLSSKAANSERYVVAVGLRSPAVAREVGRRLRALVGRCEGGAFVTSLGVEVGELTHQAFDRMAQEQADAIATLLGCVDRAETGGLRSVAAKEAKELGEMFRTSGRHGL